MINTQNYKRGPYVGNSGIKQGICPCGNKFLKRSTGKYCNRCKDLRSSELGRKNYEEMIRNG